MRSQRAREITKEGSWRLTQAIDGALERENKITISPETLQMAIRAVRRAGGVEVPARTHAVAAGAVAFFMDVKAVLSTGLEAGNRSRHLHHITHLHKLHDKLAQRPSFIDTAPN